MTRARPVSARRRPTAAAAALLGTLLALSVLIQGGCEGTSSGVDNPGLTVSFRDGQGNALRVTGTLEVYAADQNPALRPNPLKTVRVENSSFALLAGEDLGPLGGSGALSKQTAGPAPFRFNVFFRGDARSGSLASGLAYDRDKSAFSQVQGADLERLELRPAPLRRILATLSREPVHGDLGTIFIPGTGFLATVAGAGFELDGIPEGTYDLRLIGSDGRIFPIQEPLEIRSGGSTDDFFAFSASRSPVGVTDPVDTTVVGIEALGPVEAAVGLTAVLQARVSGVDSLDRRLSVLWRQIPPGLPDTAVLSFPTRLIAQVDFRTQGLYTFEVSATFGGRIVRDTALVQVRSRPVPDSIYVLRPSAQDSLFHGQPFTITWDMPARARVKLSLSRDGVSWLPIVDTLATLGLNTYDWTPSVVSDTMVKAYIRVHTSPPDSMSGQSWMFHLFPIRGPIDSLNFKN